MIVKVDNYMVIELDSLDKLSGRFGWGQILTSNLKEDDIDEDHPYNLMMDAIESLVLAHACAGIDVSAKTYVDGLQTALQACESHDDW